MPGKVPKGSRKQPAQPVDGNVKSLLPALDQALRDKGVLKAKDFKAFGIGASSLAEAMECLAGSGFEIIKGGVRVALRKQMLSLIQERRMVALSALSKLLKGSSGTEIKALASLLVKEGELKLVLRGKVDYLCGPESEALLDAPALRSLKAMGSQADKALKSRLPKSLLREDVREAFAGLVALEPGKPKGAASTDLDSRIERELHRLLRKDTGLCFLPELVAQLIQEEPLSRVHQALLRLAQEGRLELRVESGLNRLSPIELILCPPGLRDTRLGWVRPLKAGLP